MPIFTPHGRMTSAQIVNITPNSTFAPGKGTFFENGAISVLISPKRIQQNIVIRFYTHDGSSISYCLADFKSVFIIRKNFLRFFLFISFSQKLG